MYASTHTGNTFGGLLSANQAVWGTTFPTAVSQTGNRYVFANSPTLAVTSNSQTKTYGQDGAPIVANSYTATGFINAATFGNVFTQDTQANTVTGSATSAGSPTNANVGSYAIDVTPVTATTGYALTKNSTGNLTVNQAALTVTANNQTKTYGNTFTFAGTEFTNSPLQNGEIIGSVTLASAGAVNNANVGSYGVTASVATGGTFNAANYAITYVNGTMIVDPATISLSGTRTYNGTIAFNPADFGTFATGVLGQTLNVAGSGSVASANAGAAQTLILGSLALTNGTGLASNYTLTGGTHTGTINKANLTISTSDVTKTYDGNLSALGTATVASGALFNNANNGGALDSISGGTFAYTNANVGIGNKTVTTGGVTVTDGNSGGNYNVTYADNTTSTINKRDITAVTGIAANNKTYDGNTNATLNTSAAAFTGIVSGETLTVGAATGTFNTKDVLTANTVNITGITLADGGNLASNYNLTDTTASASANITAKALTATATASNKVYDGNNTATPAPTLAINAAGFVGSETVTATGTGIFNTKDVVTANTVTVNSTTLADGTNGGLASNYSLGIGQTAAANITAKALTATATASNKVYDGNNTATPAPILAINAADFIGSETVTATGTGIFNTKDVVTANTVTVNSTTLADGTNGGLASNYSLGIGQTAAANITAKALTATATAPNKVYDGNTTGSPVLNITAGLVGAETVIATGTGIFNTKDVVTANTVTVNSSTLADGTNGGLASNYSLGIGQTAAANITAKALTVTADNRTKTYGQNVVFAGTEFSSVGLVGAETIGSVSLVSSGAVNTANVAGSAYAITASSATGGTFDANNYAINYVNGSLTVNRAALTVTANNATKTQGSPNPAFSSTITGFVNSETSAVLTGVLNHSTPAITNSPAGIYAITPFGLTADNYTIAFVDGLLTVGRPANISALNGALTRPEQAIQTCSGSNTSDNAMISGLDAYGLDDVEYKPVLSQPLVGGVVANALISQGCLKL